MRSSHDLSLDYQRSSGSPRLLEFDGTGRRCGRRRLGRGCFQERNRGNGSYRSLDQDKSQTGSTPWSNELSTAVQMQFMRPGQLEVAARRFPVVYVPFGLIEWHGRHLPLGNDALKAHAILVKCAEQVGGVVYPPVYFHEGFNQEQLVRCLIRYHRISASFGSKP